MTPIKVMHVCETAKGGPATYLNTLTKDNINDIVNKVVMPDAHINTVSNSIERFKFSYKGRSTRSVINMILASFSLKKKFNPDIVFFHSSFALFALLFLKFTNRTSKFIYCSHGWAGNRGDVKGLKNWIIMQIEGRLCGIADIVVNVSKSDYLFAYENNYKGEHITIENAALPSRCDTHQKNLEPNDDIINLLFVGRHDEQKGLDILIEAYLNVLQVRNDVKLRVIGEAVVNSNSYDGKYANIEFLGWVGPDDIDTHYRKSDIVVMPSRWEAFGLVAIEAFRNGTPVLASDRGALPHIVEDGVTGYVVPLAVKSITEAIINLDVAEIREMGDNCNRVFNDRYHYKRLTSEYFNLYNGLRYDNGL